MRGMMLDGARHRRTARARVTHSSNRTPLYFISLCGFVFSLDSVEPRGRHEAGIFASRAIRPTIIDFKLSVITSKIPHLAPQTITFFSTCIFIMYFTLPHNTFLPLPFFDTCVFTLNEVY